MTSLFARNTSGSQCAFPCSRLEGQMYDVAFVVAFFYLRVASSSCDCTGAHLDQDLGAPVDVASANSSPGPF